MSDPDSLSVRNLAAKLGAQIKGNPDIVLSSIKPISTASSSDLTFFAPTDQKSSSDLFELARQSQAGAMLVREFFQDIPCTQILVENPLAAIIKISADLKLKSRPEQGVHPTASIGANVVLGEGVSIGPYVVVGNNVTIGSGSVIHPLAVLYEGAVLGKGCQIHSHASVRENVKLGDNCIIQNGSTVGTDGFGYIPDPSRGHIHIPHIGSLELGEEVEVGANSAIDRGTLGLTKVGKQSKIDNLVQIGHNNQIGERTLICGQVGIGGSCNIGSDVVLAGCVGVADHITIADRVRTAGMTGVSKDLEVSSSGNTDYAGLPPVEVASWRRQAAAIIRLPQMIRDFRQLTKRVEKLEKSSD